MNPDPTLSAVARLDAARAELEAAFAPQSLADALADVAEILAMAAAAPLVSEVRSRLQNLVAAASVARTAQARALVREEDALTDRVTGLLLARNLEALGLARANRAALVELCAVVTHLASVVGLPINTPLCTALLATLSSAGRESGLSAPVDPAPEGQSP